MKLRPYQEKAIKELDLKFEIKDKVVLSICPSGGKTFTALQYAVKNNYKTLVLAHGTDVLRSQWLEKCKDYGIEACTDFSNRFTVQLPQALRDVKLPNDIDLLIVDEAHEFYFADMVKTIIKKVQPRRTLLLTGTPSKFIKNGYETVIISADSLVQGGYVSDLYFGLATTTEPLKKSDYKLDGDLKYNKKFKKTKSSLDSLMKSIHKRLNETSYKDKPIIQMSLPTIFSKLHKTMIACHNISQADEVAEYFKNKGVKAVVSHNHNDKSNENIDLFKKDETIKVLIVVRRGVLGFDMPDLVNVVDMTCSYNIDRIYQLYARVMRKSDKHGIKFFFKLVPEQQSDFYKFYMSAALCLIRKDFIAGYNGKNLDGMQVPILNPRKKNGSSSSSKQGNKKTTLNKPIDEFFYGTVQASELLKDIYNRKGRAYNEYAFTTIGKIKENNFGIKRKITNVSEEVVKWLAQASVDDVMPVELEESMYV